MPCLAAGLAFSIKQFLPHTPLNLLDAYNPNFVSC